MRFLFLNKLMPCSFFFFLFRSCHFVSTAAATTTTTGTGSHISWLNCKQVVFWASSTQFGGANAYLSIAYKSQT